MGSSSSTFHTVTIIFLSLTGLYIDYKFLSAKSRLRRLSIDLGDGQCEWTGAEEVEIEKNPYGTLFTSYPGSGMRLTWQLTEGATGVQVGDDFFYSGKLGGIVKTQYPHPEGIWSYDNNMDQTIMLIRDPRWNIPSYHTLIYELEYAHDYVVAYDNVYNTFLLRAPLDNWIKWRDYRFQDEINLWGWQIDFWMEDGTQFWDNLDFERAGQYPFRYLYETERPWPKDQHCGVDVDCFPKALVSYERLKDPTEGPKELRKIADLLRGKKEMGAVSDEAITCVYHETLVNAPEPRDENRDGAMATGGLAEGDYEFTILQMETIIGKLLYMKHKYSQGDYVNNPVARDLVLNLHSYINTNMVQLAQFYANPPATQAPSAGSHKALVTWYQGLGRGNTYAKEEVQAMSSYWGLIEDNYNTDPTDAPTPCPIEFTAPNLNPTQQSWLDEHNSRRTSFYALHGMGPLDLKWSPDLAASAQAYAEKLVAEDSCWLIHRLDGDEYGTQSLAMNRDAQQATPSDILQSWYEGELDLTNMKLINKRFHATQVLSRSSKYVGCGQASKPNPSGDGMCHFHVCRYTAPGNCFIEAFTDVYPGFLQLMPPNCREENPNNYWLCSTLSCESAGFRFAKKD
eukprot:CAMPEP_0194205572 /NCGR_PEP_ID=MMETSP0156-20130528/4806_1 /TAXON_ID=33649 /ORGANISM="Thalassionema nitzschioides, Strain L26-B" /LENGTH=624 /DNA_ID=CAMNT_0038931881 /DNA_START=29 /DNA_END=1900 /DNA_ORIENTATION=-